MGLYCCDRLLCFNELIIYFDDKIINIDHKNKYDLQNRAYKLTTGINEAKYGPRY